MIKVNNLTYAFPQKELYNNVSFTLEDGQHGAFIGTSGTGKSTFIDMILHPDDYLFDGKIEMTPSCRIGYVSQLKEVNKNDTTTVFEYIGELFIKLQQEIEHICTVLETATDMEELLEDYQQALDMFRSIDGDNFESNITKKLNLANLLKLENLPISNVSDGEFKLIQVMKEMLTRPDILIMDEPDGFLDFDHLNGLKNLIQTHKGTLLVITHNRYLLHHCFNKIIHLENTQIQEFEGSYMDYNVTLLENKIEIQELAVADAQEIERNKVLVDNLRSIATHSSNASRGRALHARVTLLERLEARSIKAPFVDIKQPNIYFKPPKDIEETIALRVSDYHFSFDDVLLENVNFDMKSNEKIALIGENGTGKTTLLRQIFQNTNDNIIINPAIDIAFLSQLQNETLTESNTLMEEFFACGFQTQREISSHLKGYGFDKSMLQNKIESLSGGEKNTLQLAKIATKHADLLLLDEPTSHLDTYAQLALENGIRAYTGAVLMISHDFYTIVNCADSVLIIENKTIRKMSMRKFRKTIYAKHFDKDYLEIEQKKKAIETKIALALKDTNFTLAQILCEDLKKIIKN